MVNVLEIGKYDFFLLLVFKIGCVFKLKIEEIFDDEVEV